MIRALFCGMFMLLTAASTNAADLSQYVGTYRGIAPTDESAIRHGELEITISDKEVSWRFATGHNLDTGQISVVNFVPLTRDDVAREFKPGSEYANRVEGFKYARLKYLFIRDPADDEQGLLIRGNEMADILGLTILYTPAQVEKGLFTKMLEHIKSTSGDVLPQIALGGRAPKR